jgi:hypothetical protein
MSTDRMYIPRSVITNEPLTEEQHCLLKRAYHHQTMAFRALAENRHERADWHIAQSLIYEDEYFAIHNAVHGIEPQPVINRQVRVWPTAVLALLGFCLLLKACY